MISKLMQYVRELFVKRKLHRFFKVHVNIDLMGEGGANTLKEMAIKFVARWM